MYVCVGSNNHIFCKNAPWSVVFESRQENEKVFKHVEGAKCFKSLVVKQAERKSYRRDGLPGVAPFSTTL